MPALELEHKDITLIQKFRNRVTDVVPSENLKNDYWLIRWLRARDNDLEKAEQMLRKSMSWRYRNEIDTILDWKPFYNYYPYAITGHDKDGSPVMLMPIGLWDIREVVESGDVVPGFRAVLLVLATMEAEVNKAAKKFNKPSINQIVAVFDFQQFSYRQLNSRTVCQGAIEFFRIFEANYPEILKNAYFINTPKIFPLFFAMVKPMLTSQTMSKMEFYSTSQKSKWVNRMLETVSPENLPPHYGGTMLGSDEYCSQEPIWNDGPLPPDYFKTDMSKGRSLIGSFDSKSQNNKKNERRNSALSTAQSNLSREEIPAGSKIQLDFPVHSKKIEELGENGRLILKWVVKSDDYDIAFSLHFKNEFGERENLIETHRIESHVTQQEGSIVCDQTGVYTICFDNSYSKRRKKVIHFNAFMDEMTMS